jgi:hypothetical protein
LSTPTELIWSKAFIIDRHNFDGTDIAPLILRQHARIGCNKLMKYMDQQWGVLLVHVILFRYIYPSERELIPRWLTRALLSRLRSQMKLPSPRMRICRGRIFSRDDVLIDVRQWGFADLIGVDNFPRAR